MTYQPQNDFGTPESRSDETVSLTIDGRNVTVPAGTSVMRAAAEKGTSIPKLCATDSVKSFGSCRLCLVEIDGRRGTPASCTTPVEPGMVVRTQTPHLAKLRKGVMELYISDHPLDCLTCAANGDCELQDQAGAVGLRDVRYDVQATHLGQEKDHSNPYFDFDPSKCIACSRCICLDQNRNRDWSDLFPAPDALPARHNGHRANQRRRLDPAIRNQIQQELIINGIDWLQEQVQKLDPSYWASADHGEQQNTQRLSRALEVITGTGQSILSFQQQTQKLRPFNIQKIGLEMPREQLYERINHRVHQMVQMGLEEEVHALRPQFHLNALQTVGYQEWLPYLEGNQSKEAVLEAIQQNTRHYAKRQMTWFKKDPEIKWSQASH